MKRQVFAVYKLLYWLAYIVLFPLYRFKFVGRERIPDGPCIICGNHTALIDSVLVLLALGPKGNHSIICKAEMFKIPVLSWVLRTANAFPVRRGENDLKAIKTALKALKDGRRFVIFPEGTRVKNGKKSEPKPGAGMFALRSGAPIIPVYVPAGRKVLRRNVLIFGERYLPEPVDKPSIDDYMRVTNETMRRIRELGEGGARLKA